jgi:Fe-S cluster assembly ATPase SufC
VALCPQLALILDSKLSGLQINIIAMVEGEINLLKKKKVQIILYF